MNLSLEAAFVAIFLLLPGYIALSLARQLSGVPRRSATAFESLLDSLGVTALIIVILALLATAIAGATLAIDEQQLYDLNLGLLVEKGIDDYAQKHAWTTVLALGTASIMTFVLALAWGYYDPVGALLKSRQEKKNLATDDMWDMAFLGDTAEKGYDYVHVRMRLKTSGDVITGQVRGFSIRHHEDKNRDIYVHHATLTPASKLEPLTFPSAGDSLVGALVSSEHIESILVIYEREAGKGGAPLN